MPATPNSTFGLGVASDLGLGGQLSDQVAGETEEERKKRLAALRARGIDPANPGLGAASALGLSMGF
jgi:hypothetical protein